MKSVHIALKEKNFYFYFIFFATIWGPQRSLKFMAHIRSTKVNEFWLGECLLMASKTKLKSQ